MAMSYKNPVPGLPEDVSSSKGKQVRESSQKGYPIYNNIYFAFIDVLGFRQTFDEHREDPSKEFAKDYGEVFSYFSNLLQNAKFMDQRYATNSGAGQTSDSLYFYTDRPDHLAEFIKIYLHFSLYAMSQNVFFRGGIAKGNLFVNLPHQFYGDCVIKAYLLENKIAKYPQIALDKDTFEALKDMSELSDALREETSVGRYYLEPFFPVTKNELALITGLDPTQLKSFEERTIFTHIQKGKKRFEFDERNYPKYQFLDQKMRALKECGKLKQIFE